MNHPAHSLSRPLTLASTARGLCWLASHLAGKRRKVAFPWHTINRRRTVDNFARIADLTYAYFLSGRAGARKCMIPLENPLKRTKLFIFSTLYNGHYVK